MVWPKSGGISSRLRGGACRTTIRSWPSRRCLQYESQRRGRTALQGQICKTGVGSGPARIYVCPALRGAVEGNRPFLIFLARSANPVVVRLVVAVEPTGARRLCVLDWNRSGVRSHTQEKDQSSTHSRRAPVGSTVEKHALQVPHAWNCVCEGVGYNPGAFVL